MKPVHDSHPHDAAERIRDEAAAWSDRLRHRGGDPAVRQDFERWRAQDPAHAAAFARIDGAHRAARGAKGSAATAAMLQQTQARIAARRRKRQRFGMAIAASVAVVTIAGLAAAGVTLRDIGDLPDYARHAMAGEKLYRTAVGERLAVTLDDGTVLTLNTDSRAVVRFADDRRNVTLARGQALFEVAHDKTRPFVVSAGNRTVTALGTAFDVRVSEDQLAVTLLEGKVAVANPSASSSSLSATGGEGQGEGAAVQPTVLTPGDQLIVATATPAAAPEVRKADIERTVSWRQGHLIFHGDRLDKVIAEINRYRTRPLVLADTRLGDLRISGVVNTGNTAVFVETMTTYYPLQVIEDDGGRVVLGPRITRRS